MPNSIFRRPREQASIYIIVGDQCPSLHDPAHWCTFLGQETAFFQGIERLPRLLNAPVVFVGVERTQKGHYQSTLGLLAKPPYAPYDKDHLQILPLYASAVEQSIQKNPADWLWSYRRWKYSRKDKEAPK